MATKSISKNIVIRDKKLCRNLISALENAEGKSSKHVELKRQIKTASETEILKIFGDNDDRVS